MFSSNRPKQNDSFSKSRVGKASSNKTKRSFRDNSSSRRPPSHLDLSSSKQFAQAQNQTATQQQNATNSAVVTISIGHSPPRLFAAHEDILRQSPFFESLLHSEFYNSNTRQLYLVDEVPEIFSSILEFLYKGDYFPKLEYDPRRRIWQLENAAVSPGNADSTVWVPPYSPTSGQPPYMGMPPSANGCSTASSPNGEHILKDTVVYCTADKYGLPSLKRLALRKQGLQSGIPVSTILASARYAYAHTPETDSKLRAHYLALIIRSRNTFKRSGTMQAEMGMVSPPASPHVGSEPQSPARTSLWFDLFVAMCNHLDDLEQIVNNSPKPR